MAGLATGPRAARVLVELGRVKEERLDDAQGARDAFSRAVDADPSSTPAFLALERVLKALGDDAARSELYQREAGRLSGADSAYWLAAAARVGANAGLGNDLISGLYAQALSHGAAPGLRSEQQAFLERNGRWADLAKSLSEQAELASDESKAFALFRLAQVQERHVGDPEAAIVSYKAAAAADAAATPAYEGRLAAAGSDRKVQGAGRVLRGPRGPARRPQPRRHRLLPHGRDQRGAPRGSRSRAKYFERILDTAPAYLPALEGLVRVYTRLGAWDRLAAVYEQRAILAEDPNAVALQLHRAGSVCEHRLEDLDRARAFYRRALESVADFPPSVDAYLRILEQDGDWAGLARVLRSASEVTRDSNEMVSFTYRAARILADKVGDHQQAIACLQRCLGAQSRVPAGHRPLPRAGLDHRGLADRLRPAPPRGGRRRGPRQPPLADPGRGGSSHPRRRCRSHRRRR